MTLPSAEELVAVLSEQETRLVLESFTHDDALRLGMLLVEMARERELQWQSTSVRHRNSSFIAPFPGPAPTTTRGSIANDAWSSAMVRARSSWAHASALGYDLRESSRLDLDRYAAHGGSFPLRARGVGAGTVGTVTVSGLPQEDDHALIVEALERFIASQHV